VLIVDYYLGGGMTGTELAEAFARLLGHAVPTIMLTGDPANAEVPWLADAPVWVARKPLLPIPAGRACRAGHSAARARSRALIGATAGRHACSVPFAYSGNTRGRFFSMSLMRSLAPDAC
jgi:hypothetical protein